MIRLDAVSDSDASAGSKPVGPPCRHLRTNGMYVFDEVPEDDEYETSGAWCQKTMKPFGPDDDFVGRAECRDSGRPCYEPL